MKKNDKYINLNVLKGTIFYAILLLAFVIGTSKTQNVEQKLNFNFAVANNNIAKEYVYISDLDYITTDNKSGDSIQKDKNSDGGDITLKVDEKEKIYIKGIGIHAKGQITYDISEYSSKYTNFLSKIGIDASKATSSNLIFKILISDDGNIWNQLYKSENITAGQEAIDIDLDITGYKYLRIYVEAKDSNNSDYVVLGDAKLATKKYVPEPFIEYNKIHNLEYYDKILSSKDIEYNLENNYRLILEREFVRKIGYDKIQALINVYPEYEEIFDWALSEDRILEELIEVGEISDSTVFVKVLSNLYQEYKACLKTENGNVYEKMMIALAAAYSTDKIASPLDFKQYFPNYDYIERFRLVKKMYDEQASDFFNKEYFGSYHIELIRTIMQDSARNDESLWLNYWAKLKNYKANIYEYVEKLSKEVKYNDEEFFDEANKSTYDNKFNLTEYGVPFGDNVQRFWMIMQKGGINWNQARVFSSLCRNIGIPTIGSYQPGNEVAFFYTQDENGVGTWKIANNILGFGKTYTSSCDGNTFRTVFNWAGKYFANQRINNDIAGNSGGYLYLAQANLNNYAAYKKSLYMNLLANSYVEDETKLEVYNKSLEINDINLDSYDYKIQMYKALNKSSEEWHKLAIEIIDAYTYYPMAMNDLLKVIKPYLNGSDVIDIDKKEYVALQRGYLVSENDFNEYHNCFEIARELLRTIKNEIASFSFYGENADKIILSSDYDDYELTWHYSLDGGTRKSDAITEHSFRLSKEEINSITSENGIKIYIDGVDDSEPTYTINIKEIDTIPIAIAVYVGDDSTNQINEIPNNNIINSNNDIQQQNNVSYNEFKTDNFKIEIPVGTLEGVSNIEVKRITLSNNIKNMFGFDSEAFELNLLDSANNVIVPENDAFILTIDLDNIKTFKGIYVINDDDTVTEMDYTNLNDNQIEVFTSTLGKYMINYAAEPKIEKVEYLKTELPEIQQVLVDNFVSEENYNSLYVAITGSAIAMFVLFMFIKKAY